MKRFITGLILCLTGYAWAAPPVEIIFWHSMAGHLGDEVKQLINGFNKSQAEYVIKPVYKGEYTDSLTSFAAAFRAKQPPAIVQVFEVGTAIMLAPKGIIKPLNELIDEQNINLPISSFLPAVRAFYSKNDKLQAMPFNTSIPVIYYNVDALAKAGVRPETFPKTWKELEEVAATLKKAGYTCAYTTAYPGWIQIESFSALHGLPMVTANHRQALYNNEAIIHHFERLKTWQTKHYFEYGGRNSDATILFTSGRCVMFSQSSGSYNSLADLVKFKLGVAALPLDSSVSKIRHNNVIGGAALWAVAGQSGEKYRGIALFYDYIARPKVQQYWHQETGYIPLGLTGNYAMLAKEKNQPTLALAMQDLASIDAHPFKPYGVVQNQIRTINDEAIEAIFAGIKSPAEAINDAALRANFALMRFARNAGIN
ncbi:MAG: extracellular solute-binding protein [Legionella sp.]|nr:extracellular solute-binding protein [Legionella sp.]